MLTYILLVPATILVLVTMLKLLNVGKHDRILFSFCQLRRNILSLLRESGTTMSDQDYELISQLSLYVDRTIHDFTAFKTKAFNIRKAKQLIKSSMQVSQEQSAFRATKNSDIRRIQSELKYCIFNSALAYTPFLRSEIVLKLLFSLAKFMAKIGLRKGRNLLVYLGVYKRDVDWVKNPEHHYNLFAKY